MNKKTNELNNAEIDKPEATPIDASPESNFNPFSIFWGLLLVQMGVLFILQNFNILHINLSNIFKLWPILIIAAGISILSIKGKISTVVMSILLAGILALISLAAIGTIQPQSSSSDGVSKVSIEKRSNDISEAQVILKTGAGKLSINSDSIDEIVKAKLESTHSELHQQTSIQNGIQIISLLTEGQNEWWRGEYKNDLDVTLNQDLPLKLSIETGASSTNADLSKIILQQLKIDSGASEVKVKLGNKSNVTDITIDAGMSSLTFSIPKESGVRLEVDSGMSSQDTKGLRDVGDGRFESENYESATHKINIQGDMGMANLDIEYY